MRTRYEMIGVACVAGVIGLLLATPDAAGEEPNELTLTRADYRLEGQARRARELAFQLKLTRRQVERLLPYAEQAAELHGNDYRLQALLLSRMVETFGEFARQDSLNQGFTPQTQRRTGRLSHQMKESRERLGQELVALEEEARAVLSDSQKRLLGVKTRGPRGRPQDSVRGSRRFRRNDPTGLRAQLRETQGELRSLHEQVHGHPRPGKLASLLLHPYGAEQLCNISGVPTPVGVTEAASLLRRGTRQCSPQEMDELRAEVARLRVEINNWNLINGLHLDEGQIARIVALWDESAGPSDDLAKPNPRLSRKTLVALEQKVEEVLNSGQRKVLSTYKACLIPPKNLRDPVRIGQASGDNTRYERWLARARKLSRPKLTKHIEDGLNREAEHLGELTRAERQRRIALLRKTVRRAAAMSDTEFELNKPELAARIARTDRMAELKGEIVALSRQLGEPGLVARLMLKPDFIEQLRLRGKQLAEGLTTTPADLAQGPQAENCAKGCAIDGKRGWSKQRGGGK